MQFSKEEHLRKAANNEQFAGSLARSGGAEIEWAITVTFYAALHYIQAYFAASNRSYSSHPARNAAIAKDQQISPVYSNYRALYDISRDARYEVMNLQKGHLTYAQGELAAIKKAVTTLLI